MTMTLKANHVGRVLYSSNYGCSHTTRNLLEQNLLKEREEAEPEFLLNLDAKCYEILTRLFTCTTN
jgi:hypothetical protein